MGAALGEQAQLHGAWLGGEGVAGLLQALRERAGLGQRPLGQAAVGEEGHTPGRHGARDLGDAASLAEVDPLTAGVERRLRPFVLPARERKVVVQDGGGPALALLERERERAAHVLEPLSFPQDGAGCAAEAERARRLGQAELGGERERSLGSRDRLRVGGADKAHTRELGVGSDELGPGRLRLEQRHGLDDRLFQAGVAHAPKHVRERGQHPPCGD